MNKENLMNNLQEAAYWIEQIAGSNKKEPHIQDMLTAIEGACTIINNLKGYQAYLCSLAETTK